MLFHDLIWISVVFIDSERLEEKLHGFNMFFTEDDIIKYASYKCQHGWVSHIFFTCRFYMKNNMSTSASHVNVQKFQVITMKILKIHMVNVWKHIFTCSSISCFFKLFTCKFHDSEICLFISSKIFFRCDHICFYPFEIHVCVVFIMEWNPRPCILDLPFTVIGCVAANNFQWLGIIVLIFNNISIVISRD